MRTNLLFWTWNQISRVLVWLVVVLLVSGLLPVGTMADAADSAATTVTLSTSTVGNGTISRNPNQSTFNLNESVTLTATSDPGWSLTGWTVARTANMPWWDAGWRYRVPLEVSANGYRRTDMPAEIALDFAPMLAALNEAAGLNLASLRLVEVNASDTVIDANVPFQFDPAGGFDPMTKPEGTLILLMKGTTAQNATRFYHLYFDTLDQSFAPVSFTDRVVVAGSNDEGQASFHIVTNTADYQYQKTAGGFSSLDDSDGNDWITYNSAQGAKGVFRGIPNMVFVSGNSAASYFHPGFTNASSQLDADGPLRATVTSTSDNGKWQVRWNFFPDFARMTVLKADHAYWFLYEGTPGGDDPAGPLVDDYVVRPNNGVITSTATTSWSGDLETEEWVYFVDPSVGASGRALYLAQTLNDTIMDSYRPMMDNTMTINAMTVFGFGRQNTTSLLTGTQRTFVMGLTDEVDPANALPVIRGAYRPLSVQVDAPQAYLLETDQLPPTNPLALTMDANISVTARFDEDSYAVVANTSDPNRGTVEVTPNGPYQFGDEVTLAATAFEGWKFVQWEGDLTGTDNPATLLIDGNKTVTAIFAADSYSLTLAYTGQGTVTRAPLPPYSAGQTVSVTAQAATDWYFTGWSGASSGAQNPAVVQMDSNKIITATFVPVYSLDVAVDGPGAVQISPRQHPNDLPDGRYLDGTLVSVRAIPDSNALFVGWEGDLSGDTSTAMIEMTDHAAIQARFAPIYSVSTQVVGVGLVTVSPPKSHSILPTGEFAAGTQVTLQAQSGPGWSFMSWSGDINDSNMTVQITVTKDIAAVANFGQVFKLEAKSIIGSGAVSATINGKTADLIPGETIDVPQGLDVELLAVPDAGWRFVRWEEDVQGVQNPILVAMTHNESVSAVFEKTAHTVFLPLAR